MTCISGIQSSPLLHETMEIPKDILEVEDGSALDQVHKILAKQHSCYVLIVCGEPSSEGKMEVQMTYEGDSALAAYLIESAQGMIDVES